MPKQQKQFQKHIHCITKITPIAKIDHRYYTVEVGNRSSFCRNIYLLVNHHSIHKKIIFAMSAKPNFVLITIKKNYIVQYHTRISILP